MNFNDAMIKLWPNADQYVKGLRQGIIDTAPAVFAKYGIDNQTVLNQLMAQISHECGAGHDVIENLNYSAQRMKEVWPSRFPTIASAAPYAHNPQLLANKVYNGRMGNKAGSNDGWNFRGRGASQTTGRDGYERVKAKTGIDVVNNPDLLIDPVHFLELGVADFINCGCLPFAIKDDILNVTKRLNGGTIGLTERKGWLAKFKAANIKLPILGATAPAKPIVVATNTGGANSTPAPPVSFWKKWFPT